MVIKYDKDTDTLYIKLNDGLVSESDEEKSGIVIDYDQSGNVVGIEVLNASKNINQPNGVVYEVA
jgi:uncharacterized protein YuzE